MGHGFVAPVMLAAGLIVVAAGPLRHIRWFSRAPRWGISLWIATDLAMVTTLAALPVFVAMHLPGVGHDVAHVYTGCFHILTDSHESVGKISLTLGAATAGLAPGGWVLYQVLHTLASARRRRRKHLQAATLVAIEASGDTLVVDDDRPAIYCVAGRGGRIVLTRGAIVRLPGSQLAAACAHERAHLRGHHYLMTALADGLASAVPGLDLCRTAQAEIRRMIELCADDVALRDHRPDILIRALSAVSCSAADDSFRQQRLGHIPISLGRLSKVGVTLAVAALVAMPPLLTAEAMIGHADVCDADLT